MYIGIDLGNKKCGIAVYVEGIILPKAIISRVSLVNNLKKYIKEYNVTTMVVGLPYDLYGKNTKQLDKTTKFIAKLKEIFPEQVIIGHDERYTSFEAQDILEVSRKKKTEDISQKKDDIAAALILESYLQSKGIF